MKVFLLLLSLTAFNPMDYSFITENIEAPVSAYEALYGMEPYDADLDSGLNNIYNLAKKETPDILKKAASGMVFILSVVVLTGILGSFAKNEKYINLCGILCVLIAAVSGITGILKNAVDAVYEMTGFVNLLLPSLSAAGTAMGMPGTFIARQTITVFFGSLLSNLMSNILLPMLFAYVALITADAAMSNGTLSRLANLIKWLFCGILTLSLTAFITYITISGAIAGNADAVAVKSARVAISGAVPVVGGIISDAANAILTGAGIIKNAVSIFGLIAVLGIILIPFLELLALMLVYKMTSALCGTISDGVIADYIEKLSGAFSLALAMVGTSVAIVLISIISAIQATAQ